MSKDFDQLIKDGEVVKAAYLFAEEGYEDGSFGFTRKRLIEGLAERVQELEEREKELININQHELQYRAELETRNVELEHQNKRYCEVIENIKRRIHLKYETALELSVGIADEIENLYKDLEESE